MDEIATASEEQSRGISQVNVAVTQMDKVPQATSANAEESAAAAEELNAQAEQMKVYVDDLLQVVGRSGNGNGSVHMAALSHAGMGRRIAGPARIALPAPVKKVGGKGGYKAKGKARPEEVIPMNEGTDELIAMIDSISTNLTYFFREESHFLPKRYDLLR